MTSPIILNPPPQRTEISGEAFWWVIDQLGWELYKPTRHFPKGWFRLSRTKILRCLVQIGYLSPEHHKPTHLTFVDQQGSEVAHCHEPSFELFWESVPVAHTQKTQYRPEITGVWVQKSQDEQPILQRICQELGAETQIVESDNPEDYWVWTDIPLYITADPLSQQPVLDPYLIAAGEYRECFLKHQAEFEATVASAESFSRGDPSITVIPNVPEYISPALPLTMTLGRYRQLFAEYKHRVEQTLALAGLRLTE